MTDPLFSHLALDESDCFLCGAHSEQATQEHVFPKWLQRRHGLSEQRIGLSGTELFDRAVNVVEHGLPDVSSLGVADRGRAQGRNTEYPAGTYLGAQVRRILITKTATGAVERVAIDLDPLPCVDAAALRDRFHGDDIQDVPFAPESHVQRYLVHTGRDTTISIGVSRRSSLCA